MIDCSVRTNGSVAAAKTYNTCNLVEKGPLAAVDLVGLQVWLGQRPLPSVGNIEIEALAKEETYFPVEAIRSRKGVRKPVRPRGFWLSVKPILSKFTENGKLCIRMVL